MTEKISSGTWQLQEALRHSEEKHRRLLNSIRSPVLALTREMNILYCNNHYSQLVGRPIAELEGQNVLVLFPEFAHTASYRAYLKTLETGEPQEVEGSFGDFYWQVRVHPTPWGIIAIADDISERKEAEIRLRKEKQFSEAIIDALPGIFYLFDEAGRMVRWNINLEKLSGFTSTELAQMGSLGLIAEEDRSYVAAKMQEAFTEGQVTVEARFATKQEGARPYFFTGRRFLVDKTPYLLGIGLDMSERQQMETALRLNEQRYHSILAAAQRQAKEMELLNKVRTTLAQELELATIFRVIVEAIAETFGYTQVSLYLLQDGVLHLQHQVGYQTVIQEIPITAGVSGRVVRTGQPVLLKDVKSDPAFLGAIAGIVSEITVPLFDQGKVVGTLNVESTRNTTLDEEDLNLILMLSQDVNIAIHRARLYTEIRQSQETLEQRVLERTQELAAANAQLQELDRLKNKFIDDISHELRTPATTLNLYLDLLARSPEDKRERYLATLRQQSQRLNQIIESILQFAYVAETAVSQTATTFNLNEIVAEAINQYRSQAEKAGLEMTFTPAANPLFVWGVAGLFMQAIGYVLDNAIKYTPQGTVAVHTRYDVGRNMACVQIKDSGIGISPEELVQVFDRFYRGQRISQLTTPGVGLGLPLAQQIIARYGGQIEIESEVDVGTAVTVWLPLAKM
jgi:PAS domain S-box-containing protein